MRRSEQAEIREVEPRRDDAAHQHRLVGVRFRGLPYPTRHNELRLLAGGDIHAEGERLGAVVGSVAVSAQQQPERATSVPEPQLV
jgi:hypothetical protein